MKRGFERQTAVVQRLANDRPHDPGCQGLEAVNVPFVEMPPEAITGIRVEPATLESPSRSGPSSIPSRWSVRC